MPDADSPWLTATEAAERARCGVKLFTERSRLGDSERPESAAGGTFASLPPGSMTG